MHISDITDWQKSSFSPDGNACIEMASATGPSLCLRESDDPATVLTTSPPRLRALLALARTRPLVS